MSTPLSTEKQVALCDCCDKRPGTRTIYAFGIETWACDECCGMDAPDEGHDPDLDESGICPRVWPV